VALFKDYLYRLQRNHYLSEFSYLGGKYLVAVDGTEYYSSKKVSCSQCLTKTNKKSGVTIHSHQALQAVIVHPDKKQIIPMMPEEISNTDGDEKQDCEINAGKRLLPSIRKQHPRMNFVWLADSLYATSKFISLIKEKSDDNFILRIQKGDHKYLYKHIDEVDYNKHQTTHKNGKETLSYHWYKDVQLNNSCDIKVNVIRVFSTSENRNGKKTSTIVGVWATDLDITEFNVEEITKAARCRWKVENECFNTLKNLGYAIDHSYGHGKKNLAFNFYVLILLAFTLHQIHELTDPLFQEARASYGAKKTFWTTLQFLVNIMIFESWIDLMNLAIQSRKADFKGLSLSP
jgi:hypothetical protein